MLQGWGRDEMTALDTQPLPAGTDGNSIVPSASRSRMALPMECLYQLLHPKGDGTLCSFISLAKGSLAISDLLQKKYSGFSAVALLFLALAVGT